MILANLFKLNKHLTTMTKTKKGKRVVRNLNQVLLSMFPGEAIKDLIERDSRVRKQKTNLIKSDKVSENTKMKLDSALNYLKVEKTLVTQERVELKNYHNSILFCERMISGALEEVSSGVSLSDIEEAEKIISLQTKDGILASVIRLQKHL